jgi:hypothetical protein
MQVDRGPVTPESDNARRQPGVIEEQRETASAHCANEGADRKALATMKARAALCGCSLIEMADGEFLLARWNYSKAVPCLRAVGDLLRQMGGR